MFGSGWRMGNIHVRLGFGADEKCMGLFGEDESWQYGPEAESSVFWEEEISSTCKAVLVAL